MAANDFGIFSTTYTSLRISQNHWLKSIKVSCDKLMLSPRKLKSEYADRLKL